MVTRSRAQDPLRPSSIIKISSIDEYLGPSKQRFFGSGYRRSTYQVKPVRMNIDTAIEATVDVAYPRDWSRKKDNSELRPHLSTVDVMVLGIRCAEALLTNFIGLTIDEVQTAEIRKIVVRAGPRPDEHLSGLPLYATIKKNSLLVEDSDGKADSTINVQVGSMQSQVIFRHSMPQSPGSGVIDYSLLDEDPTRHWGSGYRQDEQSIRTVTIDSESLTANANIGLRHSSTCDTCTSHAPGPATFIDAFVCLLQLGQVLTYELDQIDRANSDTLWMQQLVLHSTSVLSPSQDEVSTAGNHAELRIVDHQLLRLPSGTWRNLEFQGMFGGIMMSSTFAHRILSSGGKIQ